MLRSTGGNPNRVGSDLGRVSIINIIEMKKLDISQMESVFGSKDPTVGCALMGVAAMWASIGLGPGALGVGTLTYAGCLILESGYTVVNGVRVQKLQRGDF
ncbi:hypothetical protein [Dyadobacter sp. 3J3]|uniref:hypothetical protein n=1 Tax=Dyadobacter sp. 3J3 TaxID=2606600 RepID=UPI00135CE13D|nr:hypothetical protein [Dyadobacter sp. 3J3]